MRAAPAGSVRLRRAAFAAALVAALGVAGGAAAGSARSGPAPAGPAVTVRDSGGALLAQVPLPGGAFAVSYRNSLYGTLAEERYRAAGGRFALVELAADQLAVLEEYYAVPGPVRRAPAADRRDLVARPARAAEFTSLTVAATALGERTLHVPGHAPVPLASLAPGADPTVVLAVEEAR
jgi:hypothetical protein